MLTFIVAGLTVGSIYGIAGVGLVLTYKTSGILNFAHGALATVAAYLFYSLHVQAGLPWEWAALICVGAAGPLLGLLLEKLAERVQEANLATRVVSTVGLLLVIQAGAILIYGSVETRIVPSFLPAADLHIAGAIVSLSQLIVFAVGLVSTVALYLCLRFARLGVAMRAVVDDAPLLDLAGTAPKKVRGASWVIGVSFASLSGVLLISIPPPQALDPLNLTFLVVAAFGAAAVGSFTSLPLTYLGGLAIGVVSALCTSVFTTGVLAGLPVALPFLVLFVVLLVSPKKRLIDRTPVSPRGAPPWAAPTRVNLVGGAAFLVFLALVPLFAGVHLQDYSSGLAFVVLFLSLGLLTRTSGQVSLAHVTFMAIGVCAFAQFSNNLHWPWGFALVGAGLVAVPIGALLAIPAIRLSGIFLALATFGFGILVQVMFYTSDLMFGSTGLGIEIRRPQLPILALDTDLGYYYLLLALALLATALVVFVNRSRLGRLLRALADSPTGLSTNGASTNTTRVLVFCLSAALAAMAGVLQAGTLAAGGAARVSGESYPPFTSLIYFAVIVISLGNAPWYAIAAAFGSTVVPSYFPSSDAGNWFNLLFGALAIAYAISPRRFTEAPAFVRRALERWASRPPTRAPTSHGPAVAAERLDPTLAGLSVEHLTVTFGGSVAVDDVSLTAPRGKITGLIGPNGAGKTTTFNACSGLNRPTRGKIFLDGVDVSRRGPAARARRGLGRTFQRMELFESMTVRENVALGAEAALAGSNPISHVVGTRAQRRRIQEATDRATLECHLTELESKLVADLSTGQRRLVELARCLAGDYKVLLLDEPSSGLDGVETAQFGEVMRRVVETRGVGILLVEHDMSLVSDVCDNIHVLDFGHKIFEGTFAQLSESAVVRAAYLGDGRSGELAEIARESAS